MPDYFRINTDGFNKLARDLKKAADRSGPEVLKGLVAIGEAHAELAKEIVKPHSSSIPPTIKAHPLTTRSVAVEAGDESVPLAVLYEKGNSKGKNKNGSLKFDSRRKASKYTSRGLQSVLVFRHPVFGRDDVAWQDERRYPFITVAHRRLAKQTVETLRKAWVRGLEGSDIHVE